MANDDISPDEADPIMSILIVEDWERPDFAKWLPREHSIQICTAMT